MSNNEINVQEILMKLVESNARIEQKIDHVDRAVCQMRKDQAEMEHRIDDVEKSVEVIKTKILVATFVLSVVISVVGTFLTKTFIGD